MWGWGGVVGLETQCGAGRGQWGTFFGAGGEQRGQGPCVWQVSSGVGETLGAAMGLGMLHGVEAVGLGRVAARGGGLRVVN